LVEGEGVRTLFFGGIDLFEVLVRTDVLRSGMEESLGMISSLLADDLIVL
jgi:hypothetical protein